MCLTSYKYPINMISNSKTPKFHSRIFILALNKFLLEATKCRTIFQTFFFPFVIDIQEIILEKKNSFIEKFNYFISNELISPTSTIQPIKFKR